MKKLKEDWNPNRYSVIEDKCKREIVMLKGLGCRWRGCKFCDYHLDSGINGEENFSINSKVLMQVTGVYNALEVINSGSFLELDSETVNMILDICVLKNITTVYTDCHWIYRNQIKELKEMFSSKNIVLRVKLGIETFDENLRDNIWNKGMNGADVLEIKKYFDDCCLLIGVRGQKYETIVNDINIALDNFDRICINVFIENSSSCKSDADILNLFFADLYPKIKDNPRIDILVDDNAFGVGGVCGKNEQ